MNARSTHRRLRAVNELLLDALAAEITGETAELGGHSEFSEAEWSTLLASADWHRVTPALSSLALQGAAPEWVIDRISVAQAQYAARRLLIDDARARVLEVLGGAAVPVMLLKGSALVAYVYPSSLWRDMSDVDLLVVPGCMNQARRALRDRGYHPLGQDPALSESEPRRHDAKLLDAQGIVPIELHRHLLDGREASSWPIEDVFSRARSDATGRHLLPSVTDLLMHVCVHFMANRQVRSEGALAQVRDIAWIAQRSDVDWGQVEELGRRYGVLDRVRASLATARHLGLLPSSPINGADSRQMSGVRCFVASRVLVSEARAPVGSWPWGWRSIRQALWWGRVHLGDRPAGELSDDPDLRKHVVIDRKIGASRMARHLFANVPQLSAELRAGRWLNRLDG
jgi:Uncharacterised nucleotidyltransferase